RRLSWWRDPELRRMWPFADDENVAWAGRAEPATRIERTASRTRRRDTRTPFGAAWRHRSFRLARRLATSPGRAMSETTVSPAVVDAADAVELRVLGSLIEKQRTTPDVYPLSLNALRLACNQTASRDPVVAYDEPTIRAALERLSRKGWVRLASGPGSRAVKYRHLFDEALGLPDPELALLTTLMLRGPQTLGELKQRTERLYPFRTLEDAERTLRALTDRELVAELPRRRFGHLLGGDTAEEAPETTT